MRHVRQTSAHDCGVARLSMVLGENLARVESRLFRKVGKLQDPGGDHDVIGVTSLEMTCVLADSGVPSLYLNVPGNQDDSFGRCGAELPVLDSLVRIEAHSNAGGIAILGVDSLTRGKPGRDGGPRVALPRISLRPGTSRSSPTIAMPLPTHTLRHAAARVAKTPPPSP